MEFDNSPLQVVGQLMIIKVTSVGPTETKVGHYLRVNTNSPQNPNDWNDFSQFCGGPNEDIVTTMEVLKNKKSEVIQSFLPIDEDVLMDNFGNEYASIVFTED